MFLVAGKRLHRVGKTRMRTFFSSIWTVKTSLPSVLTTVQSQKRKIISWKRKFACEFFHLCATSFQPLGTYILSPRSPFKSSRLHFHMFVHHTSAFHYVVVAKSRCLINAVVTSNSNVHLSSFTQPKVLIF